MSKYIKEDIETMLIEHKEKEAQLTEIDLKIDEYQQRLDYAGTVYEDTENEVIENMQIAGQAYDSIHSNTNKISDKVSNTVMNYQKELNHINKEDREYVSITNFSSCVSGFIMFFTLTTILFNFVFCSSNSFNLFIKYSLSSLFI